MFWCFTVGKAETQQNSVQPQHFDDPGIVHADSLSVIRTLEKNGAILMLLVTPEQKRGQL